MDYAETESIMNLVLLNPVPPYPGLANAQLSPIEQPPPAYEDPPSYTSVVGHPVGMTVGMITQIVPVQANQQQADAGAFGRIRKAYARAKKWAIASPISLPLADIYCLSRSVQCQSMLFFVHRTVATSYVSSSRRCSSTMPSSSLPTASSRVPSSSGVVTFPAVPFAVPITLSVSSYHHDRDLPPTVALSSHLNGVDVPRPLSSPVTWTCDRLDESPKWSCGGTTTRYGGSAIGAGEKERERERKRARLAAIVENPHEDGTARCTPRMRSPRPCRSPQRLFGTHNHCHHAAISRGDATAFTSPFLLPSTPASTPRPSNSSSTSVQAAPNSRRPSFTPRATPTSRDARIVAINCRGFNEALLKDLALHTRPWLGWRAHDARAPGYVDERDGCADTPQLPSSRTSPSFALPFFAAASPGGAIRAMRMRMQEAFRIQTEGWGSEQEHAEGGTRHPDVRVHWDQPPPRGHGRVM
ncbi:hypothetical protein B0H12DRAFT_1267638 [Mycena haematopus]|nr:hypothetical protein B0H12DRAFT_1274529 [Mycena haematopus]KAJ7226368.1 hypothetical protein B0H12DRAFT_1267638 [Mycena haematopus]